MGHYLSDFEDRPNYTFDQYLTLHYTWNNEVLYHRPCRQVFMAGKNTAPIPAPLVYHAEHCEGYKTNWYDGDEK